MNVVKNFGQNFSNEVGSALHLKSSKDNQHPVAKGADGKKSNQFDHGLNGDSHNDTGLSLVGVKRACAKEQGEKRKAKGNPKGCIRSSERRLLVFQEHRQ